MMTEIKLAPDSLVQEAYEFILFLKHRRRQSQIGSDGKGQTERPDFLARQKALFGNRVIEDSQVILDELRAERF